MIKKLLILFTCMVTCIVSVQAATPEEYTQVFNEAVSVCSIYKHPCTVTTIEDNKLWAQTKSGGRIEVSTKLLITMNQAQVRGVIYHEVGHVVLEHVEKTAEYLYMSKLNNSYNEKFFNAFRRQNELQADRFATYLGLFTFKETDLIGALIILTPTDQFYKTHISHPSTNDRIEQIEKILGR